jgi:hypothetical protein
LALAPRSAWAPTSPWHSHLAPHKPIVDSGPYLVLLAIAVAMAEWFIYNRKVYI